MKDTIVKILTDARDHWQRQALAKSELVVSLEHELEEWRKQTNIGVQSQFEEGIKYEQRIASLEARCREQQEQFDALYSRNVFIEASLASCRAALYDVVHCSLELGVVKRAEMALGLAKETP